MIGLLGDQRNGLDARGSGADHADAFAGEVDALVRPETGVEHIATEGLTARNVRNVCGREAARGAHDEA